MSSSTISVEAKAFTASIEYGHTLGSVLVPGAAITRPYREGQSVLIMESAAVEKLLHQFKGMTMMHDTSSLVSNIVPMAISTAFSDPHTTKRIADEIVSVIRESSNLCGKQEQSNILRKIVDECEFIDKWYEQSCRLGALRIAKVKGEGGPNIDAEIDQLEDVVATYKSMVNQPGPSNPIRFTKNYYGLIVRNAFGFVMETANEGRIPNKNVLIDAGDSSEHRIRPYSVGILSDMATPQWAEIQGGSAGHRGRIRSGTFNRVSKVIRNFKTYHSDVNHQYANLADIHRMFTPAIHGLESLAKSYDLNEFADVRASIYCVPMIYFCGSESYRTSNFTFNVQSNKFHGLIAGIVLTREHRLEKDLGAAESAYLAYPKDWLAESIGLLDVKASSLSFFKINSDTNRRITDILDAQERENHNEVTGYGAKEEHTEYTLRPDERYVATRVQQISMPLDSKVTEYRVGTNPCDDVNVTYSRPLMQVLTKTPTTTPPTTAIESLCLSMTDNGSGLVVVDPTDGDKSTRFIRSRTTFPGLGWVKSYTSAITSEHGYEFDFQFEQNSANHVGPRLITVTHGAVPTGYENYLGAVGDTNAGPVDITQTGFDTGDLSYVRSRVSSVSVPTFVEDTVDLSLVIVAYPQAFHSFLHSAMNTHTYLNLSAEPASYESFKDGHVVNYKNTGKRQPVACEFGAFRDVTFSSNTVTFDDIVAGDALYDAGDLFIKNPLAWDTLITSSFATVGTPTYHDHTLLNEFFNLLTDPYRMVNRPSLILHENHTMSGISFQVGEVDRSRALMGESMQAMGHGEKRVRSKYFSPCGLTREHDFTKDRMFIAWAQSIDYQITYYGADISTYTSFAYDPINNQFTAVILPFAAATVDAEVGVSIGTIAHVASLRSLFIVNTFTYGLYLYDSARGYHQPNVPRTYATVGDEGTTRRQTHVRR